MSGTITHFVVHTDEHGEEPVRFGGLNAASTYAKSLHSLIAYQGLPVHISLVCSVSSAGFLTVADIKHVETIKP